MSTYYLLPVHTHTHKLGKRLPAGNARDTCVIDKVRIRVDVFGKRERKEKSVNSSPFIRPGSLFTITTGEFKKTGQVICPSESCMREANFSTVWQKQNHDLIVLSTFWSICVEGLA